MRVLVACEESQEVCKAFRALGHEAYSCDIQEPSGGHPEWHIKGNVLNVLSPEDHGNNYYPAIWFNTMDGEFHDIEYWDLIIAHPPCTYLSIAGNRWFNVDRYGEKAIERQKQREEAVKFFLRFAELDVEHVAIENPIGYMNTHYRKPDCIVYPWMFGHSANKPLCWWLKGLPVLHPTQIVDKAETKKYPCGSWNTVGWSGWSSDAARLRSRTLPGVARAMAGQWGGASNG